MNQSDDKDPGQTSARRRALGAGAGALALGALAAARAEAAPQARGFPLVRVRYGFKGDFVLTLESSNIVPYTQTVFDDGLDTVLQPDGRVLINTTGLYHVILRTDWVAQQGLDIDLRKVNIRKSKAGKGGGIPPAKPTDDRLAAADIPGSSVPQMSRAQVAWNPGTLAAGGAITLQVAVSAPNAVNPGDLVLASHTSLCDAVIGAANTDAIVVHAKVVATNTVRVTLFNQFSSSPVTIPPGQLNVVAMTAVVTAGESTDAFQTVHTSSEILQAGDLVYASCYSHTPGDYMQGTNASYLQIEKLG